MIRPLPGGSSWTGHLLAAHGVQPSATKMAAPTKPKNNNTLKVRLLPGPRRYLGVNALFFNSASSIQIDSAKTLWGLISQP